MLMKLEQDIENLILVVTELEDLDEIENQVALFCNKYKVMPGSEEFDYVLEYILFNLNLKLNNNVIEKFRKLIDEYE